MKRNEIEVAPPRAVASIFRHLEAEGVHLDPLNVLLLADIILFLVRTTPCEAPKQISTSLTLYVVVEVRFRHLCQPGRELAMTCNGQQMRKRRAG